MSKRRQALRAADAPRCAALEKVLKACERHKKVPGLYCRDAERAAAKAKSGFRFLTVGSDTAFLRAGTAAQLKALR